MGGNVSRKGVTPRYKTSGGTVVKMQQHIADTPLAKRMVEAEGPEMLALMKTFQHEFCAKMVHYQDGQGEVGKKPGWVDDAG